jgi:hypothetical protein
MTFNQFGTAMFILVILFTIAYFVGQWARAVVEGTLPL